MRVIERVSDAGLIKSLEDLLADARAGKCHSMTAVLDYGKAYRTVFAGSPSSVAEEVGMMQMAIWDRLKPGEV
jgi:hypothetical protein